MTVDEIREWLSPYKKLFALGPPDQGATPVPRYGQDHEPGQPFMLLLKWSQASDLSGHTQSSWTAAQADLTFVGGAAAIGAAVPAVGGNNRAQDPYVAWWLILYAFSMLARYQPREWAALLDVDRSPLAVPLEHLMEHAHGVVPFFIASRIEKLMEDEADS